MRRRAACRDYAAGQPARACAGEQSLFPQPAGLGAQIYAALGGNALRARLDAAWPRVLYLTADNRAAALPWEYAYMGDDFLALHYGMLLWARVG